MKKKFQEKQELEFVTGVTELEDEVLEAVTGGVTGASCTNGGGCDGGGGCKDGGIEVKEILV